MAYPVETDQADGLEFLEDNEDTGIDQYLCKDENLDLLDNDDIPWSPSSSSINSYSYVNFKDINSVSTFDSGIYRRRRSRPNRKQAQNSRRYAFGH